MEIIYLGHSCFRIKGKHTAIITDPFDPQMVGLKLPKQEADIVTISHQHSDHNFVDLVNVSKKVISGPGEYELNGVSIIGIGCYHDNQKGAERGKNTIYVIEIDGFRIAHLGDLGHDLTESVINEIGDIDILMIPVGGFYTMDSTLASDVAKKIEPNITIPMHYKAEGMNDSFNSLSDYQQFITSMGIAHETLPKLVLKDGLPMEAEQKVVILEKRA